ncbi:TPA: hypothetical protein NGT44_004417 [Vibrio parahaemolyticus]|nr:hypothetical protein [Vibrio parahaemolyticus]HCE2180781.1 hypothetical protein [Vibrio parahaemolyticus]
MSKEAFLKHLAEQFEEYANIPSSLVAEKVGKKQFINGLMTASRYFDVKYEELEAVIPKSLNDDYEPLDIPAFIRDGKLLSKLGVV